MDGIQKARVRNALQTVLKIIFLKYRLLRVLFNLCCIHAGNAAVDSSEFYFENIFNDKHFWVFVFSNKTQVGISVR